MPTAPQRRWCRRGCCWAPSPPPPSGTYPVSAPACCQAALRLHQHLVLHWRVCAQYYGARGRRGTRTRAHTMGLDAGARCSTAQHTRGTAHPHPHVSCTRKRAHLSVSNLAHDTLHYATLRHNTLYCVSCVTLRYYLKRYAALQLGAGARLLPRVCGRGHGEAHPGLGAVRSSQAYHHHNAGWAGPEVDGGARWCGSSHTISFEPELMVWPRGWHFMGRQGSVAVLG